ncbi:MAG: S1 family peptidase [Aquabacterium sp.]|uniref:S1 family peptidase n=1 Tax=Aquabacterium sp. TaxID=1872578 RepID=UPI003BB9DF8F
MVAVVLWLVSTLTSAQDVRPVQPASTYVTGSAFCVAPNGLFATANHVIKGREVIFLGQSAADKFLRARLIKADADLDLALLQVQGSCRPVEIAEWSSVPIGLDVYVLGYPSPTYLGRSLKITNGLISGYRRSTDMLFQLSAAVQKGNSGGPVFSPDGLVVGVVERKLDALKMAEKNGDLVQNVSYAIQSASLCRFLKSNGVDCAPKQVDPKARKMSHQIYADNLATTWIVIARDSKTDDNQANN